MSKANLYPYYIRVRKKRTEDWQPVDNLFGSGKSLKEIIKECISEYSGHDEPYKYERRNKALKFQNNLVNQELEDGVLLQDTVYHGEYGLVRGVMDVSTGEINEEELGSDKTPVFEMVMSYLEDDYISDVAYFIIQSYSIYSYKSTLRNMLTEKIRDIEEDAYIQMKPLIGSDLVEILEDEGRLMSLDMVAQKVPSDVAENLLRSDKDEGLNLERTSKVKFSLSSSRDMNLAIPEKAEDVVENLKKMVTGEKDIPFFEANDLDLEQIKAVTEKNDKERTVTFHKEGGKVEMKETKALDGERAVSDEGLINEQYIFSESEEYAKNIMSKYREQFE